MASKRNRNPGSTRRRQSKAQPVASVVSVSESHQPAITLSHEQLGRILGDVDQLLCSVDIKSGRLVALVGCWRERCGVEERSLQTLDDLLEALVHPEDRALVRERLNQVSETEAGVGIECRLRSMTKRTSYRRWQLFPGRRSNGQLDILLVGGSHGTRRTPESGDTVLRFVLKLERSEVSSIRELTELILKESLALTSSPIGFLALVSEDGTTLTIPNWSRPRGREELIANRPLICSITSAGAWADAARTGAVTLTNRPLASDPLKRTFPGDHLPIKRFLSIPVLSRNKPVALIGVANKASDYTADDSGRLAHLMEESWRLIHRRQDSAALAESEMRHRLLVESMNEGLVVFDENCNVTYVNDRFCKMLTYSPPELTGRSAAVFLDEPDQAEFYDRLAHNKGQGYRPYEVTLRAKSGLDLPVIVSPQALFDAAGNFTGSFAVVTDVSRLKHTEARLRQANQQLKAEQAALKEKNVALRELMVQVEGQKKQLQRQVQSNIDRILIPIVNGLKEKSSAGQDYVDFLRTCLDGVTSSFVNELDRRFARLSPRELEICTLIKNGRTTKEIAAALHTSVHTVHNQRKKIRKKLKIAGEGANLQSVLQSVES